MKLASLINLKSLKEEYSSEYIEGDKVKFNPLLMKDRGFEDNLEHYDDLTGVVTKASQGELEVKLSKSIIPPGGGNIDGILLMKSEGDYEMIEKVEPGAFWDVQSGGGLKEGSMQARELADRNSLQQLQAMYDQLMRDMEQEAEPEGGPIADQYADQMQDIEDAMQIKRGGSGTPLTYDQAIGRISKDQFTKSSKFDRMNEATEKSWNAVDVSRKAEKEISNKEWNERTAKKLDMLKSLNAAGKFKKDWDEEKLQGWVDQNYSWEKLSKQFKLNESYSEMFNRQGPRKPNLDSMADVDNTGWTPDGGGGSIGYIEWEDGTEMTPLEIQDYFEVNHELYDDIMQGLHEQNTRSGEFNVNVPVQNEMESVNIKYGHATGPVDDVTISWGNESHNVDFEADDVIDDHGNEGKDMSFVAFSQDEERKWKFTVDVSVGFNYEDSGEIQDVMWDTLEIETGGYRPPRASRFMKEDEVDEGSCGYSQEAPGGKELNTPGGIKGRNADARTLTMMREVIRKEIKKLHENKRIKKNN